MASTPCQTTQVERLQAEIDRLERGRTRPGGTDRSADAPQADPLTALARPGTLVEWLADGPGTGVETLAVLVARAGLDADGAMVVVDRRGEFHPPAAVRLGIDRRRLILARVDNQADHAWALDQSLRCPGVAVVLAWPRQLDDRAFRRLQLAAEEGRTLGLLIRPSAARDEPSWADARLLVTPLPCPDPRGSAARRRLRIDVLRDRGSRHAGPLHVEVDDETHRVSVVAW